MSELDGMTDADLDALCDSRVAAAVREVIEAIRNRCSAMEELAGQQLDGGDDTMMSYAGGYRSAAHDLRIELQDKLAEHGG